MVIDEHRRHALYTRLQQVLGEEHAVALMEHLPPSGWRDVATRQDLDYAVASLTGRIDLRVAEARAELLDAKAQLLDKMASQTRTLALALVGSMATFAGVVLAATP